MTSLFPTESKGCEDHHCFIVRLDLLRRVETALWFVFWHNYNAICWNRSSHRIFVLLGATRLHSDRSMQERMKGTQWDTRSGWALWKQPQSGTELTRMLASTCMRTACGIHSMPWVHSMPPTMSRGVSCAVNSSWQDDSDITLNACLGKVWATETGLDWKFPSNEWLLQLVLLHVFGDIFIIIHTYSWYSPWGVYRSNALILRLGDGWEAQKASAHLHSWEGAMVCGVCMCFLRPIQTDSNQNYPSIHSHLHRGVLWFILADIAMDGSLVEPFWSTGKHSSESKSVSHWDVRTCVFRCRQYWVWRACELYTVVGQRDLPQLTGKVCTLKREIGCSHIPSIAI